MDKLFRSIVLINYLHIGYHLFLFAFVLVSCEAEHRHHNVTVVNEQKVVLSRCQFPIEAISLYNHLEESTSYINCDYDENGRVLKEDSFSSWGEDYIITRFFQYDNNQVIVITRDELQGVSDNDYIVQTETVTLF